MFENFKPDYMNIVNAALNKKPDRLPLYDHNVAVSIMEKITGNSFSHYISEDLNKFFYYYNSFFKDMGYDVVTFEGCVTDVFPNGGALGGHKEGCIKTMDDFNNYPWEGIEDAYFEKYGRFFEALGNQMPDGMKAIGGVGSGVFECVQDLTGYMNLCYIAVDDPQLYDALFKKIGEVLQKVWRRFLKEYGDIYCVCRFGDDLGFHSSTLISSDDIKRLIVPEYQKIIEIVHSYNKPFLLHSCGCIFDVMDDLINVAKIDAKHSNEDSIAPFKRWIDDFGDKIGNFGGIDTDVLCDVNSTELEPYVREVMRQCLDKNGGAAIGSGNSVPDYASAERYKKAVEIIRTMRGEA